MWRVFEEKRQPERGSRFFFSCNHSGDVSLPRKAEQPKKNLGD